MPDLYINGVELDTLTENYGVNFALSQFGKASQPLANVKKTRSGNVAQYPSKENWLPREGKLSAKIRKAVSYWDKERLRSELVRVIYSQNPGQLVYGPYQLNAVSFEAPDILNDDRTNTGHSMRMEIKWVASDPMWELNQPLNNIKYDTNPALYYDTGIPFDEDQPPYLFGRDLSGLQMLATNPGALGNHLVFHNWGTAFLYPTIVITNGPPSTSLYLKGSLSRRLLVTTDSSGNATVLKSHRFYLASGYVGIRFEDEAGTALNLTPYPNMRVDFGNTKLRYL